MARGTKIGNEASAIYRAFQFVDRFRQYTGRELERVVLFAEDFDAIESKPHSLTRYELVRGPSIQEYVL